MLIPNHPDDARLSALASQEADAVTDTALTSHVKGCAPCTSMLEELGALRAHLAELPDLVPHRPLRLLPDAPATPDRLGLWVRKVFGPVMAAGAALALVGMVGTVAPNLSSQAGSAPMEGAASAGDQTLGRSSLQPAAGGVESLSSDGGRLDNGGEAAEAPDPDSGDNEVSALRVDAERSPWPMVLFAGIAVLVAAAMLRWILVPRAG